MRRMAAKVKSFFYWVWQQCRDWRTVALLILVIAVVYSPVWGGFLLQAIFGWKWAGVMASAVLLFWAGPMTPFFPLCVAITLAIKRFFQNHNRRGGS